LATLLLEISKQAFAPEEPPPTRERSRSIERTEFREITRRSIDQSALLSLCWYLRLSRSNPGSTRSFVSVAYRWLHSGNARPVSKIAAPANRNRGYRCRGCDVGCGIATKAAFIRSRVRDVAGYRSIDRAFSRQPPRSGRLFSGSKNRTGTKPISFPEARWKALFGSCDRTRSARLGFARAALRNADDGPCRRVPLSETGYPLRFSMSDISRETLRFLPESKAVTTLLAEQKKGKCCESPRKAIFPDERVATHRAHVSVFFPRVPRRSPGLRWLTFRPFTSLTRTKLSSNGRKLAS